jgi:hypothetical protein
MIEKETSFLHCINMTSKPNGLPRQASVLYSTYIRKLQYRYEVLSSLQPCRYQASNTVRSA